MFFSAFDDTGDKIREEMEGNKRMYAEMVLPYLSDADYNPTMMDYELTEESPLVLQSQLAALEKMQGLADDGLSAEDELAFFKANQQAGDRTKRASGAIQQNALARGVSGGGMEFALREQANQESARRAQEQGMAQAAATARGRAMNQMAYSNQLGQVRDQDYKANAVNTNIINRFNQMNTSNRNDANLRNMNQRRQNEQQRYNNEMSRAAGMSGASQGVAQAHAAQGAQNANDFNNAMSFTMGMGNMAGGQNGQGMFGGSSGAMYNSDGDFVDDQFGGY